MMLCKKNGNHFIKHIAKCRVGNRETLYQTRRDYAVLCIIAKHFVENIITEDPKSTLVYLGVFKF